MSILIKGMEMPTSCRTCHMKMNCDDCEGHECVCVPLHERIGYLDDLLTDKRRDDCPLTELPPHGRLIDVDAFSEFVRKTWADCDQWILGYLEACNTIIEASPTQSNASNALNALETCNKYSDDVVNASIGKWIDKWYCSNMSGYEYAMNCSVCGKPTYRISLVERMPNYCPHCGARMVEDG